MAKNGAKPTILVVDDDEVLGQVLSRVLTRDDRTILQATNAAQALQLADKQDPQLALVDLCLPDIDGLELAKDLRSRHAKVPLILMTAYPMRLREHPEMANHFTRILTKPLNLQDLRQAVDSALGEETSFATTNTSSTAPPEIAPGLVKDSMPDRLLVEQRDQPIPAKSRSSKAARFLVGALVGLVALAGIAFFLPGLRSLWKKDGEARALSMPEKNLEVELAKDSPRTLVVPRKTEEALGIRDANGNAKGIVVVLPPEKGVPLVLSGSTALDPTRLQRIRARFPAEVIKIGQVLEDPTANPSGPTSFRELRTGDRVSKGDELLVFWSVEVGTKKSELVDALVQLRLDKEILDRSEAAGTSLPVVNLLTARRNVEADQNTIAKIQNTLQTWGIPKEDVQLVIDEAKQIAQRKGDRDRSKEQDWARVVIKANEDGVIIERNVNLHELVVDNSANLFVIAQVDRLSVQAHAREENLAELQKLDADQRNWTVSTVGAPPQKGKFTDIGYLVDPNQHSVLVKGYIDNPGDRIRGGQFVSVAIDRPAPPGVVEVPITAILEDGKQSVVFVQPDPKESRYTLRPVQVTRRFEKTAYVRSEWSPEEEAYFDWLFLQNGELVGVELLKPGERVLTSGALELKAALQDEESKSR
jgi:cobalt-zinc-cadmium efflux system membrane fusion protein